MSIKSLLAIAATGVLMVSTATAGELDRVQSAPQGLIIREDAQGNKEVFRDNGAKVTDAAALEKAVSNSVVEGNKIAKVVKESELDRTTSSEAWFWGWGWGYGYGWGNYYGYYYGGYANYYYPAYWGGWYGGYRYSYWCW